MRRRRLRSRAFITYLYNAPAISTEVLHVNCWQIGTVIMVYVVDADGDGTRRIRGSVTFWMLSWREVNMYTLWNVYRLYARAAMQIYV